MTKRAFGLLFNFALAAHAAPAPAAEWNDSAADCLERWAAAPRREPPGAMALIVPYIDPSAGFSMRLEGELETTVDGRLVRMPSVMEGKGILTIRLGNNVPMRCLTKAEVEQLGLPKRAEWLAHYADPRDAVEHDIAWGHFHNRIGATKHALVFLERARASGSTSSSLAFELGFALNALGRC